MDKGHGLLERFLISVPLAPLKPTPKQEEEASEYLASLACNDFATIIRAIEKAHKDIIRTYALDSGAFQIQRRLKTDSVHEVNCAPLKMVKCKSKGTDLVARVAVSLSTVVYCISTLLEGEPCNDPPENI